MPTSHILHPTSYILHPKSLTLNPIPSILASERYPRNPESWTLKPQP